MRRLPPSLRPGPLNIASAAQLNDFLNYLASMVGNFSPAAPLQGAWDRGGLRVGLDGSGLFSANQNLFGTITWTVSGGPLIIGGTGGLQLTTPFEICGLQFWCCFSAAQFAANQNNLDLPSQAKCTVYLLSSDNAGPYNLTGIIPGKFNGVAGPQIIALINTTTPTITLTHSDAGSSAANRFFLPNALPLVLKQNDIVILWYDTCNLTLWRVFSTNITASSSVTFSGARVTNSTSQVMVATQEKIAFDTETFDTTSYHDNVTNNTRLTAPSTGYYSIGSSAQLSYTGSGLATVWAVGLSIKLNNTTVIVEEFGPDQNNVSVVGHTMRLNINTLVKLTSGDYVEALMFNGSVATGTIDNQAFWIESQGT